MGKGATSEARNISSEMLMCGGSVRSILLLPLVAKCLKSIDVCIWRMFVLCPLILKSINFSLRPESLEAYPHLEEFSTTDTLGNTELIITNVYIFPAGSCIGYHTSLDHLIMTTDTIILG